MKRTCADDGRGYFRGTRGCGHAQTHLNPRMPQTFLNCQTIAEKEQEKTNEV